MKRRGISRKDLSNVKRKKISNHPTRFDNDDLSNSAINFELALNLKPGDKIDVQDSFGRYLPATLLKKSGSLYKFHFLGWHKKYDEEVCIEDELHRLAKFESRSNFEHWRLSFIQPKDEVRVMYNGFWHHGHVKSRHMKDGKCISAQVQVSLKVPGLANRQLRWYDLRDESRIKLHDFGPEFSGMLERMREHLGNRTKRDVTAIKFEMRKITRMYQEKIDHWESQMNEQLYKRVFIDHRCLAIEVLKFLPARQICQMARLSRRMNSYSYVKVLFPEISISLRDYDCWEFTARGFCAFVTEVRPSSRRRKFLLGLVKRITSSGTCLPPFARDLTTIKEVAFYESDDEFVNTKILDTVEKVLIQPSAVRFLINGLWPKVETLIVDLEFQLEEQFLEAHSIFQGVDWKKFPSLKTLCISMRIEGDVDYDFTPMYKFSSFPCTIKTLDLQINFMPESEALLETALTFSFPRHLGLKNFLMHYEVDLSLYPKRTDLKHPQPEYDNPLHLVFPNADITQPEKCDSSYELFEWNI